LDIFSIIEYKAINDIFLLEIMELRVNIETNKPSFIPKSFCYGIFEI
jgi:hypothetical protein